MGQRLDFGASEQGEGGEKLYSRDLDRTNSSSGHLSAEVARLRQGHLQDKQQPGGPGASLRASTEMLEPHMQASAGANSSDYCDSPDADSRSARDGHGAGRKTGVGAGRHEYSQLIYGLKGLCFDAWRSFRAGSLGEASAGNHRLIDGDRHSKGDHPGGSLFAGKGDQFRSSLLEGKVSVFAGQTPVDSHGKIAPEAGSFQYRHQLGKHLDLGVSAISEGSSALSHRLGVAPELWVKHGFLDNKLSLSVGAGVYTGVDLKHGDSWNGANRFTSGIESLGADYRLTNHLDAQAVLHRAPGSYGRESNLLLSRLRYRF